VNKKETKKQRNKETKKQRNKETKKQRNKETKKQRNYAIAKHFFLSYGNLMSSFFGSIDMPL